MIKRLIPCMVAIFLCVFASPVSPAAADLTRGVEHRLERQAPRQAGARRWLHAHVTARAGGQSVKRSKTVKL